MSAPTAKPAPEEIAALARRIPPLVHFGASSWNYPGWTGMVYHRLYEGKGAPARMLEEYARFPLFRTVGIDSSFYAPPTDEVLRAYADHLPPGFPCVSKVWDQLTVHTFSKPRDPARAGKVNPDFLNPEVFLEAVLEPYRRHFADHMGAFVFEFQAIGRGSGIGPAEFADRIEIHPRTQRRRFRVLGRGRSGRQQTCRRKRRVFETPAGHPLQAPLTGRECEIMVNGRLMACACPVWTSGADLTFATLLGANTESECQIIASGPLIPTFAKCLAQRGCECWNRTTRCMFVRRPPCAM